MDLILFNHLATKELLVLENSGFIDRCDKMMANFGNPGFTEPSVTWSHLAHSGDLIWFTLANSVELIMLMG